MIPEINLTDYYYELPKEKIALYPLENRDNSKLLVINRINQSVGDEIFKNLPDLINESYHLVLNNTKVIPARFHLIRPKKNTIAECFLISPTMPSADPQISLIQKNKVRWKCLMRGKKIKVGEQFYQKINENLEIYCVITKIIESNFEIEFTWNNDLSFFEILNKLGSIPLPPYIEREIEEIDKSRYQTVFAKNLGSVAAPTAALHFTDEVLEKLKQKNIQISEILLNVGAGTFKPIFFEDISEHKMHEELFTIDKEVIESLLFSVKSEKKILSVGTTTVRTLESLMIFSEKLQNSNPDKIFISQWDAYYSKKVDKISSLENVIKYMEENNLKKLTGSTELLIMPGYQFRLIDALITNFHQPHNTLILLVSAFMGKELWQKSYNYALKNNYRFLSYGDSSIIF
jgi:S-adenosylmethionine:tRNA ribosyltransferase-isomerase